jgi:PQQ-like domain
MAGTTGSASSRKFVRRLAAVSIASGSLLASASTMAWGSSTESVARAAATAASWPQPHYGPTSVGVQPDESKISAKNVKKLVQARTYPSVGASEAPLVSNGVMFVDNGDLYAFDATGTKDCTKSPPVTCTPLWKAPTADASGMTIGGGMVYVDDSDGIDAFDASGSANCTTSGGEKTCLPVWRTSINESTGPGFSSHGDPLYAGGILYVPGYGDGGVPNQGGALVSAFDPKGNKGCAAGTPRICVPLWTTIGLPTSSANSGSPTVSGGDLYIATGGTLYAFSASGTKDCPVSKGVKSCKALWTGSIASPDYSAPSVSGSDVYLGTWGGIYAFSATGTKNCSVSDKKTLCKPIWSDTLTGNIGGTPAVYKTFAYTVTESGQLLAFSAAGTKDCSGSASSRTCSPIWESHTGGSGYVTGSSPAVANGVVYFSSTDGGTYAYDAAGTKDCSTSGALTTCSALWSAVTGKIGGNSASVANGVVYIDISGNGTVYAYSLPS